MAHISIYFGEMGSGKSHNARLQARYTGIEFIEGDDVVIFHPDVMERVVSFKPLTREMVIRLTDSLIEQIVLTAKKHSAFTVAQALYFDEDRLRIETELTIAGHVISWNWVRPGFLQNMRQLLSRPKGIRWVLYWLMNKPYFERPTHQHVEI